MDGRPLRLVVAFHTTAASMAAEQLCRQNRLEGRLIPVPRRITSDCGIAWSAPVSLRRTLEELFDRERVDTAGFYELPLE